MNKLEENRQLINEIDKKIVELFEQRMLISKEIALYKKENNLPIFDEQREKEVLKKNSELLKNKELLEYYLEFQKKLMEESKKYQKTLF